MAVKLVVLYTQPEDVAAFDDHYVNQHMPLVADVPGLVKAETSKFVAAPDGGEQTYFRMAELYFDSLDDLQSGLASEAGAATAKDYRRIAPEGSRMFIAQLD